MNKKISDHIVTFIGIAGFLLIIYIWFTQNDPIFISLQKIGLFTTVLPFAFGLASWIFGWMNYVKVGKIERRKIERGYIRSYICCCLAVCFFMMDVDLRMRNKDVSSIRDLSAYYNSASLLIVLITTWINTATYKNACNSEMK